jgi:hypothetical protein
MTTATAPLGDIAPEQAIGRIAISISIGDKRRMDECNRLFW